MAVEQKILCQKEDWGLIDYAKAWALQKERVGAVIAGQPDLLIFCEHPAVFTLGRLADEENFLISPEKIHAQGIAIEHIDRGGEVTLHAPGQLVIYPIFNLRHFDPDLKLYLRKLEQVAVDLLQDFDIVAHSIEGRRGVWVDRQKIVSMGIGVRRWVSFHGMAVNVNTNLDYFRMIRPCGLDVTMTSIEALTGQRFPLEEIKAKTLQHFKHHFNLEFV